MMQRTIVLFILLLSLAGNGQLPSSINFKNYTRAKGLPEEHINNMIQDSHGFLWLGAREGLICFDDYHFSARFEIVTGGRVLHPDACEGRSYTLY